MISAIPALSSAPRRVVLLDHQGLPLYFSRSGKVEGESTTRSFVEDNVSAIVVFHQPGRTVSSVTSRAVSGWALKAMTGIFLSVLAGRAP